MDEGWDCMRHYEILACGCVPFFTNIEICPKDTMVRFPKDLMIEAKKLKGLFHTPQETGIQKLIPILEAVDQKQMICKNLFPQDTLTMIYLMKMNIAGFHTSF